LFALWNPPIVDEESGARRSPLTEGSMLVRELTEAGIKTIAFARSRRAAELLADFARRDLSPSLRPKVKAYRAGYLPEDRRRLEQDLASGELMSITSTNALELGIDIGSLDASVLVGYPGTRASMWQQAGRAGRATEGSLAIMIAQDDPLDQYLVAHPDDLFDKPAEAAVLDPTNPFILEPHLACASRELPLKDEELGFFGPSPLVADALAALEAKGELVRRKDLWHHRGRATLHRDVDIRSSSGATFSIVIEGTGELLGSVDEGRAYIHVHPGAIYLHQGAQFEVTQLGLDEKVALVAPSNADFYTQSRDVTDVAVAGVLEETTIGETIVRYGNVTVTTQITGFVRKALASGEIIDTVPLDLPAQTLTTRSLWLVIPEEVLARAALKPPHIPGSAHAAEHAAIGLLPLIATCDRWDIGGISTPWHADTNSCAIFVYDAYQGGAGITERGFRSAEHLLRATLETVRSCPCGHGCPGCVQSPKCGNGNEPLDKTGAVALLSAILGERWG
jgi:DEAD/DEAH box helicase domain-containing protein